MKGHHEALVQVYLAAHHGVISQDAASGLGLSPRQWQWRVTSGRWQMLHRGVYFSGGAPGPEARLVAACLAAGEGAAASHESAAWMWDLVPHPPPAPTVTVPRPRTPRLAGARIHRRCDLDQGRVVVRRGIPVTDPLRTLADLGETVGEGTLDDAVDRALAAKLLTVHALEAELGRLARRGRRGPPALRSSLERRGMVGAPHPSVLESRVLRLLRRWGIRPAGVEVVAGDGRYRLDILLREGLALEVDGYAFHWSPESKAADSRRRNELRLAGTTIIEADWVTVMRDPQHLRATVDAALRMPVPDQVERRRSAS